MSSNKLTGFSNLIDLLIHKANYKPHQTAYTFLLDGESKEVSITYRELDKCSRAIAARIKSVGVCSGERVLLLYSPGLDFITAFFGCLYASVIAVPTPTPRYNRPMPRLKSIIKDATPKAVLTTEQIFSRRSYLSTHNCELKDMQWIVTDTCESGLEDNWQYIKTTEETVAFIQYTSGSTSTPKGVIVGHGNILHNEKIIKDAFIHTEKSIIVGWLPLFHDMGLIGNIIQPIYAGAPSVLMSPMHFLQKPLRWLQAISHYKATTSAAPNFAYDLCIRKITSEQKATLDLSSWEVACNGAEPVLAHTLKKFAATFAPCGFHPKAFYPCYGMAEATLIVSGVQKAVEPSIHNFQKAAMEQNIVALDTHRSNSASKELVSCGRPLQDTKAVIVHPEKKVRCLPKEIGEIWVSGSSVGRGYWNQPEHTEQSFEAYLTDTGEGPFLRTGDLGFLYDDELFITGRIKDLIIIRGCNHYPQDIELTVSNSYPAFKANSAAAFTIEVEGEEKLVIVSEVERSYLRKIDIDKLSKIACKSVLEHHNLSVDALLLLKTSSIPRTSSGKIRRQVCRQKFIDKSLDVVGLWQSEIMEPLRLLDQNKSLKINSFSHNSKLEIPSENIEMESKPIHRASINRDDLVAEYELSKSNADTKIQWLRNYAQKRINSRLIDERRCIPPYIVLDLGNQGILGMQIPKKYGGMALSNRDALRVFEQLAAIDLTLASFVGVHHALGTRPIVNYAKEEVQNRFLPDLAKGRELGAFALTEPGAGSNPKAIATVAVPDIRGGWRLRGEKMWVGSGSWSGTINVFAQLLDDNGNPSQGIAGFVLSREAEGLRQGSESLTMGMRGMVQNTIYLEDVFVTPESLLGQIGKGMTVAQDAMMFGRLGLGAISLGGIKRCAQLMLRYSKSRFISTGRLLDNPITLARLSDITNAATALEALIYRLSDLLDNGLSVPTEAYIVCKTFGPEFLWQAADHLVQLLGGRGYIETNIAPQILRDSRLLRIFEGPTETLNMFIGSRAINNGEELYNFLSQSFNAVEISQRLKEGCERIKKRHILSNPTSANYWVYALTGELVTFSFLQAAVQETFKGTNSGKMNWAFDWASSNFERVLKKALSETPSRLIAFETNAASDVISQYAQSIGDLEQHLEGENRSIDRLLRKNYSSVKLEQKTYLKKLSERKLSSSNIDFDKYELIQDWIKNWFSKKLKVPITSIDANVSFNNYRLDSILAAELSHDLENYLDETLESTIIWNFPNIKSLAKHLAENIQSSSRDSFLNSNMADLESEVELSYSICPDNITFGSLIEPSNIFLTGATGFLGAFLLYELLEQTNSTIYCLVRSSNEKKGKLRIQNNLDSYGLWKARYISRVKPVIGDLSKPYLSLSNEQFQWIASQIDTIFHSAASLNFVHPYSALKAVNVIGTKEVLRLACSIKTKPVHYVSTFAVFESIPHSKGNITESDDLSHNNRIHLGYAQSKWVAEKIILIARQRGLPVNIYRPSMISGHSKTGICNTNDFVCRTIKGCIQMGSMPNLDLLLDMSPVDYVSKAIIYLSQQEKHIGQAFHLINSSPIHWNEFGDFIRSLGYSVKHISYAKWQAQLENHTSQKENHLSSLLPFFSSKWTKKHLTIPELHQKNERALISCEKTVDLLSKASIYCPPVDNKLLNTYFSYFVHSKFLNYPL